ncbi:hypothetical protein, partial [Streptomyces microflavus]|uniref:hypothetical protein n=1 Tax=Streptomyces microflavus TaxID=1919 RepID=UPI0033ACED02
AVPAATPFTVPPVLFAKITEEDLESYRERRSPSVRGDRSAPPASGSAARPAP